MLCLLIRHLFSVWHCAEVLNAKLNRIIILSIFLSLLIIIPSSFAAENTVALANDDLMIDESSNDDLISDEISPNVLLYVVGAFYYYVISIKKFVEGERGYGMIVSSIVFLVIAQVAPLVFALIVTIGRS